MQDSSDTLTKILNHFPLSLHPEGGAYLETYRSTLSSSLTGFKGERSASTGIFFLLKENEFSSFHRIKSDEMWHFYLGDPLEIIEINQNGEVIRTILGQDFNANQKFQYVVPAGSWFAAAPLQESRFSFVGCTVAPGFDFNDFELAEKEKLSQLFPEHSALIARLTR